MPAKSGSASHSSTNVVTPFASMRAASAASDRIRARRSRSFSRPGDALISTNSDTLCGRLRARCNAKRPPMEYPMTTRGSVNCWLMNSACCHMVCAGPPLPWPGRSMASSDTMSASRSTMGPTHRDVWAKPCRKSAGWRCCCGRLSGADMAIALRKLRRRARRSNR